METACKSAVVTGAPGGVGPDQLLRRQFASVANRPSSFARSNRAPTLPIKLQSECSRPYRAAQRFRRNALPVPEHLGSSVEQKPTVQLCHRRTRQRKAQGALADNVHPIVGDSFNPQAICIKHGAEPESHEPSRA